MHACVCAFARSHANCDVSVLLLCTIYVSKYSLRLRMAGLLGDCVGLFLLVCFTKVVRVVSDCQGKS